MDSSNYKRLNKTIHRDKYAKRFLQTVIGHEMFCLSLKKRLEEEKDAFILVTGDTGTGKSTLVARFCFQHFSKMDNFIMNDGRKMFEKENFIVDPEEFAVKMIKERGAVLWIDEGRDTVNRQQWFSKINQVVASRKNRNRKNFNIYFLLMPYEREIDPKLAAHLTAWIWVKKRKIAELYVKTSGKKGGKGLDIDSILKREERYLKENPFRTSVDPTIHPEYRGKFYFSKLTPGFQREYNKLVEDKKAVGELTEEEKLAYGIVETITPETYVNNAIDDIKKGVITNKRQLWNKLKEETELEDDKLTKILNRYLDLEGFPTFRQLFKKDKLEQIEVDW